MLHCKMITGGMAPSTYEPWIEAILVVSFDIDEGQKVSLTVPEQLPTAQEKQISMLAFPDSNSCNQNENIFKYLFRTQDNNYAFVCFKQKKDPNNPRGYSQKSFVILTKLPFLQFYEQLVELIVFKLFPLDDSELREAIEKVFAQSRKWPDPQPLSQYIVPVLDYELEVEIPNYRYDFSSNSVVKVDNMAHHRDSKDISMERIVTRETLMQFGRFQEVKLTETFEVSCEELWMVWESVMLNKAFLMISDSPYRASRAVLAAVSLMNPLQYGGEYYPYVTVYDSHLDRLQQAKGDVLLGGTNPLFLKLFANRDVQLLQLGKGKIPKRLKPQKEFFLNNGTEQQQLVNESSLRKFFYRVNCGVISALQAYVEMQTNDLKFFNEKDFLRFVRKQWTEDSLLRIFDGHRAVTNFWQTFVRTRNFALLLSSRNIMREKEKN